MGCNMTRGWVGNEEGEILYDTITKITLLEDVTIRNNCLVPWVVG